MYIGLGCALENLLLAAGARGLAWRLGLMPDRAHATHVARIDLTPGPRATSELYEAIPHRHTNRGPYDRSRAVPPELLDAMTRSAGDDARLSWLVSDTDRRRLGQVIVRATQAPRPRAGPGARADVRAGAHRARRRRGLAGVDDLPGRLPDAGGGTQSAPRRRGASDLGISRSRARRYSRSGLRCRSRAARAGP